MLTKEKIYKILQDRIVDIPLSKIAHFKELTDIHKATDRIIKAINNNEKIVIVGDYDVDGVTSSVIMKQFFSLLGVEVEIKIPNRFKHGYGLSLDLLDEIEADLIITVDNGISSFEAAIECKKRGIDLIITDHHTPSDKLPDAYAIINPKISDSFSFKEICGAEVAWYLCASIKHSLKANIDMRGFFEYLTIAIIADVMPLTHLNRAIVKQGLKRLNNSNKPFVKVLKKFLKIDTFTSEIVAFQIAPRLNSAGRMEDASIAFKFLDANDEQKAFYYLQILDKYNLDRKEIEKNILNQSINDCKDQNHFLVTYGQFHEGVIGIVANRLVEKYKLPAIVFSDNGDILKGSGRSLGDVNIYEIISKASYLLEGFGGHKLACGLSIKKENLNKFMKIIKQETSKISKDKFFIEDFVLGELDFRDIDFELMSILNYFEPYGHENPRPKFKSECEIYYFENLKDNHYRLILKQNDTFHKGVLFNYDGELQKSKATITYTINENIFNNQVTIQLVIEKIDIWDD